MVVEVGFRYGVVLEGGLSHIIIIILRRFGIIKYSFKHVAKLVWLRLTFALFVAEEIAYILFGGGNRIVFILRGSCLPDG